MIYILPAGKNMATTSSIFLITLTPLVAFLIFFIYMIKEIKFRIKKIICNPGKNICNKIEKSSKTGQKKKSLISTFARCLTAIAKV